MHAMTPYSSNQLEGSSSQPLISRDQFILVRNMALVQTRAHQALVQEVDKTVEAFQSQREEIIETVRTLQEQIVTLKKENLALKVLGEEKEKVQKEELSTAQRYNRTLKAELAQTKRELDQERKKVATYREIFEHIKAYCDEATANMTGNHAARSFMWAWKELYYYCKEQYEKKIRLL